MTAHSEGMTELNLTTEHMKRYTAPEGTTVANAFNAAHDRFGYWLKDYEAIGAPRNMVISDPVPREWVAHLASGFDAGQVVVAPVLEPGSYPTEQGELWISTTSERLDAIRNGNMVLATQFTPRWPVQSLGEIEVLHSEEAATTVTEGEPVTRYIIVRQSGAQFSGSYPTMEDAVAAAEQLATVQHTGPLVIRGVVRIGDHGILATVVPSVVRARAEAVFATFDDDTPIFEFAIVRGTAIRPR